MENRDIMAFARTRLRGNWGVPVATFLVYLVITFGLDLIPVIGWIGGFIIAGPLLVGLHLFHDSRIVRGIDYDSDIFKILRCSPYH